MVNIQRFKLPRELFENLEGRFCHVSLYAPGKLYLAGGAARGLLRYLVVGGEVSKPNDYDWTIVGMYREGANYGIDARPKGSRRIEVEHGAPHASLSDYMWSRDFGVNEVAIDAKGYLYATKMAQESFKLGVLLATHGKTLTHREAVRACRFCIEYNLKMPGFVRNQVKHLWIADEAKVRDTSVFSRYSELWDIEGFIRTL
ncbi:MAG: hypothetical protein EOM62_14205 [Bacteroidia bacterium]|nr:hypothetical protein [Bacteroidia bacterium]